MIDRYTKPETAAIWSEQRKAAIMLEVELRLWAMEKLGTVPEGTAAGVVRAPSRCCPRRR